MLGLLDDLAGAGESGGFRGHLRALRRGRLTTGSLKLFGGAAVAVAALAGPRSETPGRLLADAALVALSANLANLFDRAPGRLLKVTGLGFVVLAIATGAPAELVAVAVTVGAGLALVVPDLREQLMVGDVGANVLGATLGCRRRGRHLTDDPDHRPPGGGRAQSGLRAGLVLLGHRPGAAAAGARPTWGGAERRTAPSGAAPHRDGYRGRGREPVDSIGSRLLLLPCALEHRWRGVTRSRSPWRPPNAVRPGPVARTKDLTKLLAPGDIAVIDHADLDRVAADALVEVGVAAVVNASPSITGRYPNTGPLQLVDAGIPLIDDVGPDIIERVTESDELVIEGGRLLQDGELIGTGTRLDHDSWS